MSDQAAHPVGERESRELGPVRVPVDTFAGRVHGEWDAQAAATPLGQLRFFTEFLQVSGLFGPWVRDCPLHLRSPNAPSKRDVLGTAVLSILTEYQRYAHINGVRNDRINPPLLGMSPMVLRRQIRAYLAMVDKSDPEQLRLSFAEPSDDAIVYGYAVLVTSLTHEILTIAQIYRDRAALASARRLIEECGYGRRLPELEDAERSAEGW